MGYFLEINATWYRYGLGFYDAAPNITAQFRTQLDEEPKKFLKAIRSAKLVDDLIAGFGMTAPFYHYLLDTITRTKPPTQ